MKKLLTVTCLAGLLSIPSVVFAEASWYGSIRVGVQSASGGDTAVTSFGSRWGIKGSSEVSEGLTAVYHYSQKIDATNATVPDGDFHSYIGLEGAFGSLTLGRVTSAAYGTVGVITNKTYSRGPGGHGIPSRVGNAIHYGLDVSGVKLQADLVMNSKPADIDEAIFGISVPIGDIGKIAFAHVSKEGYDTIVPLTTQSQKGIAIPDQTQKGIAIPDQTQKGIAIPDQTGKGTSITAFTVINNDYGKDDFQLPFDRTKVSFGDDKYTYIEPEAKDGKTPKQVFDVLTRSVYEPVTVADDGTVTAILKPNDEKTVRQLTDYDLVGTKYYHQNCTDGDGKAGNPFTLLKTVTCQNSNTVFYYNKDQHTVGATPTDPDYLAVWSKDPKLHISGNYTVTTDVDTSSVVDKTTELPTTIDVTTSSVIDPLTELPTTIDVTTSSVIDPLTELPTTIDVSTTQDMGMLRTPEHKSSHIAAEATLGAVKGYLGYSEWELDGVKTDATQFGISGGLGESGVSYIIEVNKEDINTPWGIGIYKTLGGGASVNFEHGNNGTTGTSVAFIAIDF